MSEQKSKRGKKPKTLDVLPDGWQKIVVDNMSQGASQKEVIALLGIGADLYYAFIKRESEFADAVKKGVELSEAWWERQGRLNLTNKSFNAVLWYMNMKNRFGWKDKQEIEHTGEVIFNVNSKIAGVNNGVKH